MVEGGLQNITPYGDALESIPTHVIINFSAAKFPADPMATRSIRDLAGRLLSEIPFNEIFYSGVDNFLPINLLDAQEKRKGRALARDKSRRNSIRF